MTRLIIVRHAESEHNLQNRIQGHADSDLTVKGLRQAKALGRRLKRFHVDKIFSSDLGRAYATTLEIAAHKRIPIKKDPLLREIQLGEWEELTPEEVDRLYDKGYQRWLKNPSKTKIPKSEGVLHFRRRVTKRLCQIAKSNRGKTVLIVTHGGVIAALLTHWLRADFDTILLNLQVDNTSLTLVEESQKRTKLKFINDATHLAKRDCNEHLY